MPAEKVQEAQSKLDEQLALIKEDKLNAKAYFKAAFQYQALGQYKNAEEYYLKSLSIDPNNFAAHNNLAALYEEVKEYDLAIEQLKLLTTLNPPNMPEVITDGVRIYLEKGEPDSAQQILQNYITTLTPEQKTDQAHFLSGTYDQILTYREKHAQK